MLSISSPVVGKSSDHSGSASNPFCKIFFAFCAGALLSACSSPPSGEAGQGTTAAAASRWWGVYFFILWPQNEEPHWHIDGLIAEEVVKPVLNAELQNLQLWRFHRRARRDDAGHRFRFLFYAPRPVADRINAEIRRRPAVAQLEASGTLLRVAFVDASGAGRSGIEATSDWRWPIELQRSWPHYIMGASRMWLDLLDQSIAKRVNQPHDEALYREVHQEITALWKSWGQHAGIHHLEALYAYEPPCTARSDAEAPSTGQAPCVRTGNADAQ